MYINLLGMAVKHFKFTTTQTLELDEAIINSFLEILKYESLEKLESLIPDGPRDASNESSYQNAEKALLPLVNVELFWDNFNDPGLLFQSHETILQKGSMQTDIFQKISIDYLALWDGDTENSKSFEITVSAVAALELVDGLNIEAYLNEDSEEEIDEEIQEELCECSNMFNFSLDGIDVEDEDVFENEWSIVKP